MRWIANMTAASLALPVCGLWLVTSVFGGRPALADAATEAAAMPTDGAGAHLFLDNPAIYQPSRLEAGGLAAQRSRDSELDQTDGGDDKISSEVADELIAGGIMADAGAGMGVGVFHAVDFRTIETSFAGRGQARKEAVRSDESSARAVIELADGLSAGFVARLVTREFTILGDDGISQSMATRYRTVCFGYSGGLAWKTPRGGLTYNYRPPLHGKTRVEAEDRIVAEPGLISAGGWFKPADRMVLGLTLDRVLNEVDDLAAGTTASDDQTRISLYGLDVEQYVNPVQSIGIGVDLKGGGPWMGRLAVYQDQTRYNFREYMRFDRVDVQQSQDDSDEGFKRWRLKASAVFTGSKADGIIWGEQSRFEHELPASMGGATYTSGLTTLGLAISAGI